MTTPDLPPDTVPTATGVLERFRPEHAAALARAIGASLDHLRPWMPWASPESALVEHQMARSEQTAQDWATGVAHSYVLLPEPGGEVIGAFGLHRRIKPGGIEIGYWVHADHVGRGHATAAAAALTEVGLALGDVDHVEIHTDEANVRSAAVPQKLGYWLSRLRIRTPEAPAESGRMQFWRVGSVAGDLTAEEVARGVQVPPNA